jgi:predicted transcriptional regulator
MIYMSTTLGIKVDDLTRARLANLSKLRKRSTHSILQCAVDGYLQKEEEYEADKAEDMARWEEYQLTGDGIDHKDLLPWLESLAAGKYVEWNG